MRSKLLRAVGVIALIVIWLLVMAMLSGCAGTGFERQTSLMPDEFSITQGIDSETFEFDDQFKIGFKWKFK